jgi:alkaline phosphatase
MGPVVNVMLGGGRYFFLPTITTGSCRKDTKDMLTIRRKNIYIISDCAGVDALQGGKNATKPYLAIFTSGHMPNEIDRNNSKEP